MWQDTSSAEPAFHATNEASPSELPYVPYRDRSGKSCDNIDFDARRKLAERQCQDHYYSRDATPARFISAIYKFITESDSTFWKQTLLDSGNFSLIRFNKGVLWKISEVKFKIIKTRFELHLFDDNETDSIFRFIFPVHVSVDQAAWFVPETSASNACYRLHKKVGWRRNQKLSKDRFWKAKKLKRKLAKNFC